MSNLLKNNANVIDVYPLTAVQKGLLFNYINGANEVGQYSISTLQKVEGPFNLAVFKNALQRVFDNNPCLRTGFYWEHESFPLQFVVRHLAVDDFYNFHDCREKLDDFPPDKLEEYILSSYVKNFDLKKAGQFFVDVVKTGEDEYYVVLNHHHIILDGWSCSLILEELWSRYADEVGGTTDTRKFVRPDFKTFIRHTIDDDTSEYANEFKRIFENYNSPSMLGIGDASNNKKGKEYQEQELSFSNEQREFLINFAKKNSVSVNNLFQALWALLVSFYTNSNGATFGITVSGRIPEIEEIDKITGLLINTLPLHFDIDLGEKFEKFLRKVADVSNAIIPCVSLSLSEISKMLNIQLPMFDSLLVYENYPESLTGLKDIKVSTVLDHETNEFPLSVLVVPGEVFKIRYIFDVSRFEEYTINCIHRSFEAVIDQLKQSEDILIGDIDCLSPYDQDKVLRDFNCTNKEFSDCDLTVCDIFERIATLYPDSPALVFKDNVIAYRELSAITTRIAAYLQSRFPRDKVIGVFGERSEYLAIILMSILKSGAAYLPLDPDNPDDRLLQYIEDANCSLVIFTDSYSDRLINFTGNKLDLRNELEKIKVAEVEAISSVPLDNPAYVLFTSGSTGRPKGAVIPHRALTNRLLWMREHYHFCNSDKILQKTPFGFDVSVWEFFLPLISGASLIMAEPNIQKFPDELKKVIDFYKVTTVHFVPSMLEAFIDCVDIGECKSLKRIFVSGEELTQSLMERVQNKMECDLHNLYGPTECTIDVTSWDCKDFSKVGCVSIGKPISNIRCYVLDKNNKLLPPYVRGELFIGGVGLAIGYINNESLTAERFPTLNFKGRLRERLYKTGDEVHFTSDGNIVYHGRLDFQVKIHGFRVELGEIEKLIEEIPFVKKCIADVKTIGNGKKIVAYVLTFDNCEWHPEAVRDQISQKIPSYMIPSYFIRIEQIPVTGNGKVNKKALPLPEQSGEACVPESFDENEIKVAEIWSDLLGCDISLVRKDSNFFFMGGDSILSILFANRLSRAGFEVSTKHINEYPVFADLMKHINISNNREKTLVVREKPFSLSPIQRWFFSRCLDGDLNTFNQYVHFDIRGSISIESFKEAVDRVIGHYDAFDLRFKKNSDEWEQSYTSESRASYHFISENVNDVDVDDKVKQLSCYIDITKGPVCVIYIAQTAVDRYKCIFLAHHLVVDSVSWSILIEDIFFLYHNSGAVLPKISMSFQQWVQSLMEFSKSKLLEEEIPYWREVCQNTKSPNPVEQSSYKNLEIKIDIKEFKSSIDKFLYPIFLAVFSKSLSKIYKQDDLLIELESHGREVIVDDSSRSVGWFTSKYPFVVKTNLTTEETFLWISSMLKNLPNKGIGFGVLRYLRGCFRDEYFSPRISFNFLGRFSDLKLDNFDVSDMFVSSTECEAFSSDYELDVNVSVHGDAVSVNLSFDESVLSRDEVESFSRAFEVYLKELMLKFSSPFSILDKIRGAYFAKQSELEVIKSKLEKEQSDNNLTSVWPLTSFQEGIFLQSYNNNSDNYKLVWEITYGQDVSSDTVHDKLKKLINAYDVFRIGVVFEGIARPLQYILKDSQCNYSEVDLTKTQDSTSALKELKEQLVSDFDVHGSLSKFVFVKLKNKHVLLCVVHHMIMDGWSAAIVSDFLLNKEKQMNACSPQFSDFLEQYFSSREGLGSKEYWENLLAEAPIPLRFMQPSLVKAEDEEFHQINVELSTNVVNEVLDKLKQAGVDIASYCYSVFSIVLGIFSFEKDLVFGTIFSGRSNSQLDLSCLVGPLANSLPVRVRLTDEKLVDLIRKVREQITNSQNYEQTSLREICKRMGIGAVSEIFDILFVFQNYPTSSNINQNNESVITSHYGLTFIVEKKSAFLLRVRYKTKNYSHDVIEHFLEVFKRVFETACLDFSKKVSDLDLFKLSNEDVLDEKDEFERLEYYFKKAVQLYPSAIAVEEEGKCVTYQELDRCVNDFSRKLNFLLANNTNVVGVYIPPSIELVAVIIALLKIGKTVSYLDSLLPSERIQEVVKDSGMKSIVAYSEDHVMKTLRSNGDKLNVITLETIERSDRRNLDVLSNSHNELSPIAFICYTSGSSGKPKGVMLSHSSAINRLIWLKEEFPLKVQTYPLKSSLMFAPGQREIFEPLIQGKKLVIFPQRALKDDLVFMQYVFEKAIGKIFITPSFLSILLSREVDVRRLMKNVEIIELSGEAYIDNDVLKLKQLLPNVKILNRYGCTEAASVVYGDLTNAELGTSLRLLGKPIRNVNISILDCFGRELPSGILGEICITSKSVAEGYLNNEKETKEKFERRGGKNQWNSYRTGDIGLITEEKNLMYWGRKDSQIKIRGYRVELKEVEEVLSEIPEVKVAAIVFNTCLTAFVVMKSEGSDSVSILNQLKNKLPDFMLPKKIIYLKKMPLLSNGKIDYQNLQSILQKNVEEVHQIASVEAGKKREAGEIEQVLCEIWKEILPNKEFGIDSNFFDMGGDSLLLMKCSYLIEQKLSIVCPINELIEHNTISDLVTFFQNKAGKNGQDKKKIVFFFPPAGGGTHHYEQIKKHLSSDIELRVLHLSEDNIFSSKRKKLSIPERAEKYISLIKSQFPHIGSFILGGWSMGGTIAYEVARKLTSKGGVIKKLIMIDSGISLDDQHTYSNNGKDYRDVFKRQLEQSLANSGITDREKREIVRNLEEDTKALDDYHPGSYKGEIVLIKPLEVCEKERNYKLDYNGWNLFVIGKIKKYEVSGNHNSMIELSSQEIAEIINSEIKGGSR